MPSSLWGPQSGQEFHSILGLFVQYLLSDSHIKMNLLWTKITTTSILGALSLLTGFVPILVARKVDLSEGSRGGLIVSMLSCFSGGVILTTALTHMLPEVNQFVMYNRKADRLADDEWPLAEIWVLCGFFMVYLLEEVGGKGFILPQVTSLVVRRVRKSPSLKAQCEPCEPMLESEKVRVRGNYQRRLVGPPPLWWLVAIPL